jgi:uncharacterized membrane protein YeaQ/YmgE (transglycosylase-associated protein family)
MSHTCAKNKNSGEQDMNVVTWLIVGGAIGWLANRIMKTAGWQALVLNVVVGIVGGLGGGWLLSPLMGADAPGQHGFSGLSLVVSFSGAMILLVIVNLIRQIAAGGD